MNMLKKPHQHSPYDVTIVISLSQMEESGLIYGLEYQCRALCSLPKGEAYNGPAEFLVGTQSLKSDNQIHILDFELESASLSKKKVLNHPEGEIWDLEARVPGFFYSRYGPEKKRAVKIWKDGEEEGFPQGVYDTLRGSDDDDPLKSDVVHASWHPTDHNKLMILSPTILTLHDLNTGSPSYSSTDPSPKKLMSIGAWNPHQNSNQYACVHEYEVRVQDLRSSKSCSPCWKLENPGGHVIRSLDFNPNKQYYLATAGDDGRVSLWDVRKTQSSLSVFDFGHSHWIWSVQFNPFHDQILITSGSDGQVILSSLYSLSSGPCEVPSSSSDEGENDSDRKKNSKLGMEDGVIKTFEDHEDSVYKAVWSLDESWVFASLSYDGRVVLNQVPRKVVYKVLNLTF